MICTTHTPLFLICKGSIEVFSPAPHHLACLIVSGCSAAVNGKSWSDPSISSRPVTSTGAPCLWGRLMPSSSGSL